MIKIIEARIGDKVYIEHPQSNIRPFVVITAIIEEIKEYSTKKFDSSGKKKISTSIGYTVRLKSGTLINIREEEVFSKVDELIQNIQREIDKEKKRLNNKLAELKIICDY